MTLLNWLIITLSVLLIVYSLLSWWHVERTAKYYQSVLDDPKLGPAEQLDEYERLPEFSSVAGKFWILDYEKLKAPNKHEHVAKRDAFLRAILERDIYNKFNQPLH